MQSFNRYRMRNTSINCEYTGLFCAVNEYYYFPAFTFPLCTFFLRSFPYPIRYLALPYIYFCFNEPYSWYTDIVKVPEKSVPLHPSPVTRKIHTLPLFAIQISLKNHEHKIYSHPCQRSAQNLNYRTVTVDHAVLKQTHVINYPTIIE